MRSSGTGERPERLFEPEVRVSCFGETEDLSRVFDESSMDQKVSIVQPTITVM